MRRLLLFLLLLLLSGLPLNRARAVQQTIDSSRAPFGIELPEIETGLLTATTTTDVFIPPGSKITLLRLWVLNPYATRVGYSINASLGGQSREGKSLGIVGRRGAGKYGHYLEIDLSQNPDIRLQAGKNVIEVTADERDAKVTYHCSFVLMPGKTKPAKPNCDPNEAEIRIEQRLAPPDPNTLVNDRTAPQITLTEPRAALVTANAPFTVRVAGTATDNSGVVVSVTANSQTIATPPPPAKNEKKNKKDKNAAPDPAAIELKFDQTVTIPANTYALLIEAQDRAGNRTLITVPVLNANCAETAAGASPAAKEFGGRKFALVVGVSKYLYHEGNLDDLAFADKDAEAIRDWLRTGSGGGFKLNDVVCLTNENATLESVERAIQGFLTNAKENDLIYLFLAGHGAPDPYDPQRLYFLLHKSKMANLPNTAFPMSKLGEFLEKQSKQVRLIAFFDTCHSAGIKSTGGTGQPTTTKTSAASPAEKDRGVGQKKPANSSANTPKAPPQPPAAAPATKPAPASGFNFYETQLFKQKGWTILTSSGINELSREDARWGGGHGVFTWALLEGAQGKADANGDCRVTAGELAQYVTATVSRETGKAQNPQSLPGSKGDLVVASVPAANCRPAGRK